MKIYETKKAQHFRAVLFLMVTQCVGDDFHGRRADGRVDLVMLRRSLKNVVMGFQPVCAHARLEAHHHSSSLTRRATIGHR